MSEAAGSAVVWRYGRSNGTMTAIINYTVSNSNTTTTVTLSSIVLRVYTDILYDLPSDLSTRAGGGISGGGQGTIATGGPTAVAFPTAKQTSNTTIISPNVSYSYSRGHSASTQTFKASISKADGRITWNDVATVTLNVSVPAKPSYTVSYNANGGSGAPSAQTKWYGETLTLQSGTPTRTGYTFQGWATSSTGAKAYNAGASYTANAAVTLYAVWKPNEYTVSYNLNDGEGNIPAQTKYHDTNLTLSSVKPTKSGYTFNGWATSLANAQAGTVAYAAGGTYSANAAVTLYAVWELAYTKPQVLSATVERCNSDGSDNDDGKYAKITFDWVVYKSSETRYYGGSGTPPYASNSPVCTVALDTYSATPTLTNHPTSLILGNGQLDPDTQYSGTITISDTQQVKSDNTTVQNITLTFSAFPIDFNGTATAMGIFMPAPDTLPLGAPSTGLFVNGDIYLDLHDYNAPGTIDYDLYEAIVALGWDDDVFVD